MSETQAPKKEGSPKRGSSDGLLSFTGRTVEGGGHKQIVVSVYLDAQFSKLLISQAILFSLRSIQCMRETRAVEVSFWGENLFFPPNLLGASCKGVPDTKRPRALGHVPAQGRWQGLAEVKLNILTRKNITDQAKFSIHLLNHPPFAKILETEANSGIPEIQRLLLE